MCPTKIHAYIEALTPTVIIFGDGAFGRQWLGLCHESGLTLLMSLWKRERHWSSLCRHTEERPCEGQRVGSCLKARMRAFTRKRICRYLDCGFVVSRTVRKINSVVWFTQSVVFYFGSSGSLIKPYNMIITAKTWCLSLTLFCLQYMKFHIIWNTYQVILNNKQII